MRTLQLSCFACGQRYEPNRLIGLCACGKPLRVDLAIEPGAPRPSSFEGLSFMRDVLPIEGSFPYRTLGEGATPLLETSRLGAKVGFEGRLYVKDESLNPTGSFKARGMAMAVYQAARLGAQKLAVPSAGNAGGALAAYAALYGLEAHVFMPRDAPAANRLECGLFGATLTLVDGLINDCAKRVIEGQSSEGWFDVSTLKEPYRIEGKKTMGYEIVAQLGWRYPDVILYPTGGGTGLIGMWKAFEEMEKLGWVSGRRPRMVSVQAKGCAPIVRAWESGPPTEGLWTASQVMDAQTVAAGLRVPRALGDFVILEILRMSGGRALAVSDEALIASTFELSEVTGICACPEGGACLAALRSLVQGGEVSQNETVVLFNTGSGLKYAEALTQTQARKVARNLSGV